MDRGGSTITQQLVRGYFLKTMTAQENSDQLRHSGRVPRILSNLIGARTVNMLVRKAEEILLSVIRRIVRDSSEIVFVARGETPPVHVNGEAALSLVQEGLRGVVRLPGGTAHALGSRRFPIAVTGKAGTTNEFRDALFVGSTYGPDGITVAVRIGFDDNRSLGSKETGGKVALPVFKELDVQGVWRKGAGTGASVSG